MSTTDKAGNKPEKKNLHEQNIKTLNQLALRPNITIKKKVILKNYENTQKNRLHNMVANLQNHAEKNENKSMKNVVAKKKVGLKDKLLNVLNAEYYPDRCKRNLQPKKIKLQPKHEYKVVAVTNKRKRRIPHRDISSIPVQECPGVEEMSLSALVQLAEDQGLDDDDFMEILTCPSPVWWEDSDDDLFHEDLDVKATDINTDNIVKTTTDANANKVPIQNKLKTDINFYKKFVTKRSKLECILGKIRSKKTKSTKKKKKSPENTYKAHKISTKCNTHTHTVVNTRNINNCEQSVEGHPDIRKNENNIKDNNECINRKRRKSSGGLSDISINEDELLNTLENIEIPVKILDDSEYVEKTIARIKMKYGSNDGNLDKPCKRRKYRDKKFKLQDKGNSVKDNDIAVTESDMDVPTDLPPLTKNPFNNVANACESPKSLEGVNSESVIELDSISDTNIKFLDEYVDAKKEMIEAVSVKTYGKGQDGELVTVYQIVSNKTDSTDMDIEQQIKVNLVNKPPQTSIERTDEDDLFLKRRQAVYRSQSKLKKE